MQIRRECNSIGFQEVEAEVQTDKVMDEMCDASKENENPEYRNCRMKDKSVSSFFGSRNQFNSAHNIVNERMHLCK